MADVAFFEGRQTTPIPPAHSVNPQSPLQMLTTAMECNPVGSVVITPIVQDQLIGDYVREFRIFSAPSAAVAEPVLLMSVRMHALTIKALEIMTPAHVI
jgi:hypothetical protein